ncbi:MAG: flagellar biosynthetic protein FliO [Porticoccus sp.]|nr:flagellar biosynthetic protein FliO [Porticoccus sp.]MBQ0807740.1 flagellar biosynthetic protein FliO [Porticoccus sp.]
MSNLVTVSEAGTQAVPQVTATSDTMIAMAMLGKTAAALALVIAAIWLCSYAIKRINGLSGLSTKNILRIVSTTAVGQRERVVVVEIQNTWLVLGVGTGEISKLHELEAPLAEATPSSPQEQSEESFASRLFKIRRREDS